MRDFGWPHQDSLKNEGEHRLLFINNLSPARPILFPRNDDSLCDRIDSSLTAVHCFDNSYVEKQPIVWTEYCAECWLKELQESMDRCTGRHDISEMFKTVLNTIQSVNL